MLWHKISRFRLSGIGQLATRNCFCQRQSHIPSGFVSVKWDVITPSHSNRHTEYEIKNVPPSPNDQFISERNKKLIRPHHLNTRQVNYVMRNVSCLKRKSDTHEVWNIKKRYSHDEKVRQICEMRNGNEACLTTTAMKSGHRSKLKVVLALGILECVIRLQTD